MLSDLRPKHQRPKGCMQAKQRQSPFLTSAVAIWLCFSAPWCFVWRRGRWHANLSFWSRQKRKSVKFQFRHLLLMCVCFPTPLGCLLYTAVGVGVRMGRGRSGLQHLILSSYVDCNTCVACGPSPLEECLFTLSAYVAALAYIK